MAINYVKFQRGSKEAYDALKTAGKLDENTLYFIYPEADSTIGALFMGSRVISGGDIITTAASLSELSDVMVAGAGTNSFLVKEGDKWVAKTVEDVASLVKENLGDIAAPAQVFQGVIGAEESNENAITRVVGEAVPVEGDSLILKKLIADGKYEYTAYVYSGEGWAAMDGNYNAENVYFANNLTYTSNIGVLTVPSSGNGTIVATGKNLKEVLASILAKRVLPNKTNPSVSVSSTNSKEYEVGTKVSPAYTSTFSAGSYTYGPTTGVSVSSWKATLGEETLTTQNGTFAEMTVADDTNIRIAVVATHTEGVAPKDNLGSVLTDSAELAQKQIQAGEATGYGSYIKGFRNLFYTSKIAPVDLTSANIRGMTSAKSTTNTIKVSVVEGAKQVVIAVPSGRKVTVVKDEGAFGTDIFSSFVKSVISVGGADATAESIGSYAKDYNVYVYTPAAALGANTYTVTVANE